MLISTLLLSLSAYAASGWQLSTEAATAAYRADYQAEKGQAATDPLGFSLERGDEELLTRVYFVDSGALRAYDYGCHQHSTEDFDCHRENRLELGAYNRNGTLFPAEGLVNSVGVALDLFEKKEAPEASISALKLWEAEGNIWFTIRFNKDGEKSSFLACHFHGGGGEIDCHRKRGAGPAEPEAK